MIRRSAPSPMLKPATAPPPIKNPAEAVLNQAAGGGSGGGRVAGAGAERGAGTGRKVPAGKWRGKTTGSNPQRGWLHRGRPRCHRGPSAGAVRGEMWSRGPGPAAAGFAVVRRGRAVDHLRATGDRGGARGMIRWSGPGSLADAEAGRAAATHR